MFNENNQEIIDFKLQDQRGLINIDVKILYRKIIYIYLGGK